MGLWVYGPVELLQAALEPPDGAAHPEAASSPGWSLRSQPHVNGGLMSAPPQKGAHSQKRGSKPVFTEAHERATGLQANREEIKVSVWVRKPLVMLPRPGSAL